MKPVDGIQVHAPLPHGGRLTVTPRLWKNLAIDQDQELPGQVRSAAMAALYEARLGEPLGDLRIAARFNVQGFPNDPALASVATALVESACVVADRAARGLVHLPGKQAVVLARSDNWNEGRLVPLDAPWQAECLKTLAAMAGLGADLIVVAGNAPDGEPDGLAELRATHPEARISVTNALAHFSGRLGGDARAPRSFEVLFPLLDKPGFDDLYPVRVSVSPAGRLRTGTLEVHGNDDKDKCDRAKEVITAIRGLESESSARWDTVVRLPSLAFSCGSFELALAVADRVARGREWPGPGRIIATGAIDTLDEPGAVCPVSNVLLGGTPSVTQGKLALLQLAALPYDSILLPEDWRSWAQLNFRPVNSLRDLNLPQVVFVRNLLPRSSCAPGPRS
jgi:hypothetical protein